MKKTKRIVADKNELNPVGLIRAIEPAKSHLIPHSTDGTVV